MTSRSKVYISGPITGMPSLNRAAFDDAAAMLRGGAWYGVVNPHDNGLPIDAPWEQHMRADLALLLGCTAIYMLHGWERSRGARIEHALACDLGMTVLYA